MSSEAAYSAATNVSVTDFSVQALINAGLDIDVSVSLQFSFIIVVTVFVICFEYVLESIEHVIARHPTYWTLLNKMYRELLVGGLTAFVAKRLDQWDAIAKYDQAKLNISDDIVLYFSLSIAIQSAIMFMMLRVRNEKVDKLSVLSARDLLEYMSTDDGANPWSQFSKSIMTTKILQNFFLTTYKLPDVFSFPKYVRSIQDSEIFSLFDVEIIEWILLVAVYTIFFWIAEDFESIRFIEEDATDDIIEAGIDVEHAKMILATRLEVLLVYILILTIALWALYAYVRRRVHDIVLHASNGRKSYLEALEDIANKEDARLAKPMTNDEAIAVMMEFADSLTDVEDHSSIWDLIKSGARRLVGRAHAKDKSHMQWQTSTCHSSPAKPSMSLPSSSFNASVVPVIKSKQATWYPLSLLGLMAILVFNMLFFAPQLVRHLALVNATVRVNPHELKAVIEHFSDVLEMQTDMADAIVTYCDAHGKDIKDLEHDIVAMDPQATGYIEGEALRDIISHYGFKFSANKFQTFVCLQFKTRGTRVPYADFFRVLYGLTEQLTSQHDSLSELLSGKNLHSEYLNSLRRDRPSESFLSGTTSSHGQRRPNHAMLFKLSAINQFNAKDNAESQAKVSPRKVAAVAV
ncbi:unnamed protein product [Aphanomyces euteiches]